MDLWNVFYIQKYVENDERTKKQSQSEKKQNYIDFTLYKLL